LYHQKEKEEQQLPQNQSLHQPKKIKLEPVQPGIEVPCEKDWENEMKQYIMVRGKVYIKDLIHHFKSRIHVDQPNFRGREIFKKLLTRIAIKNKDSLGSFCVIREDANRNYI